MSSKPDVDHCTVDITAEVSRGQQKILSQGMRESPTLVFRCRQASQARDVLGGLLFVLD